MMEISQNPLDTDEDVPAINGCRVLIVESDALICKLIQTRLEIEGIPNIEIAHDGKAGLKKLSEFDPDLIILDINIPVLDGREVLRLIRAKPRYKNLPVIIESAFGTEDDREELMEMGATNIIAKPINHTLLARRVRVHLEHQLLIRNLRDYRKRLSQELEQARNMQADLLPSSLEIETIAEKHGLKIDHFYRPSSELGGDFWTIQSMDKDRIALLMIDFTGHGIGASINTFRLNMILKTISPLGKTPGQFLGRINTELCRILRPTEFATAFFGILNTTARTFDYAAAGSPPPMIAAPQTMDVFVGDSRGLPLGIVDGTVFTEHHLALDAGSEVILLSDAFSETNHKNGAPVGNEGIVELIKSGFADTTRLPATEAFYARYTAVIAQPPQDDMTLIWLHCRK